MFQNEAIEINFMDLAKFELALITHILSLKNRKKSKLSESKSQVAFGIFCFTLKLLKKFLSRHICNDTSKFIAILQPKLS